MSLFSSVLNALGADKAAKTQERAANAARAGIEKQYQQTRADLAPFREAGTNALTQLSNLYGLNGPQARTNALTAFQEDPGYQYQRQQAIDAVQSSGAARGMGMSGATLSAISDRTQNLANQQYGTYLGRLFDLQNVGQTSAAQTGNFGAQSAAQQAGLTQDAGAYKAQQALIPGLAWRQFTDDVKSAFTLGAFGR